MYLAKINKIDNTVMFIMNHKESSRPDWSSESGHYFWIESYNDKNEYNFAGVGDKYLEDLNDFIGPSPFPSWVISPSPATWVSPVSNPDTDMTNCHMYEWSEDVLDWVTIKDE
jgi:hypothetical protein